MIRSIPVWLCCWAVGLSAYADRKLFLSKESSLNAGFSLSLAGQANTLRANGSGDPTQGQANQPTSASALFPKFLSLRGGMSHQSLGSLHSRLDYHWNQSLNLTLYQKSLPTQEFIVKDLYVLVPFDSKEFVLWGGIKTFELPPLSLFAMSNPFDQIALQGGGIAFENLQISVALHTNQAKTIATATGVSGEPLLQTTDFGGPVYYNVKEYVATLFLSGRLLLAEGRLFEPLFAFRYYTGGRTRDQPGSDGSLPSKARPASALIAGGVFSRPLSDGLSGSTTAWFASFPADTPVSVQAVPADNVYGGAGRADSHTPANTIGLMDSSTYDVTPNMGFETAFLLTNNTYNQSLPVLKSTAGGAALSPDGQHTANSNNRLSLGWQPLYGVRPGLIAGLDVAGTYVSEKLFYDDVNSLLLSAFLRVPFEKNKLHTNQFAFVSVTAGQYDWRIKKSASGAAYDREYSVQLGSRFDF